MASIYDPQSQWNPAWSNLPLGAGVAGSTIGKFGCFITVAAMILTHYLGRLITPVDVNALLLKNNLYFRGNLWTDQSLPILFSQLGGSGMVVEGVWNYMVPAPGVPADLSKLAMDDTQERLVVVDFNHNPRDGISTHALRPFSWNGKDLVVDDPWFGHRENFTVHYGANLPLTIQKIVGYKVPGFVPAWKRPAPPIVVPDPRDAQIVTLKAQVADLSAKTQDLGSRLTQIHSLSGGN